MLVRRGTRSAAIILVRVAPSVDWVRDQVARMNVGVRLGTYREVAGIGNRSFLYKTRSAGAVLCTFGGGDYLQISLFRREDSGTAAALEKLAGSALGRMANSILASK